jgi:hypothetical protein
LLAKAPLVGANQVAVAAAVAAVAAAESTATRVPQGQMLGRSQSQSKTRI